MYYIIIGLFKILDNLLATAKTIFVQKNQKFFAMLTVMFSQLLFYIVVSKIIESNSIIMILLASVCAGIGSYLALFLNDRFSKDRTYINIITANSQKDMEKLSYFLRCVKVKNIVLNTINKQNQPTLAIMVFAETKDESRKIDKWVDEQQNSYFRQII